MSEQNKDSKSVVHIDLGDLSKPATALIERISEAIGGLARPWQIRRVAEAEAAADKITAVSEIEISQLQRRALNRFIREEAKRQQNIESITQKALPGLSDKARPQEVDDDWLVNFFDKGRLISDDQMQELWAKLLSGEANSPSKFSKRTVNLPASMDRRDAEMFGKLCRFVITAGQAAWPVVYDFRHEIYSKNGMSFDMAGHLASIGLVQMNAITGYRFTFEDKKLEFSYFDTVLSEQFDKVKRMEFEVGFLLFTRAGQELSSVCHAEPVAGFVEYLKKKWAEVAYNFSDRKVAVSHSEN